MKYVRSAVVALFVIISPAGAVDKEKAFKANRAETYPAKATQDKVVVAVSAISNPEEIQRAFGKADLQKFGILPVLVVIDNNGPKALKLNLVGELEGATLRFLRGAGCLQHQSGGKQYNDQQRRT